MQCVAALGKNNLVVRLIQSRPAYHIILSHRGMWDTVLTVRLEFRFITALVSRVDNDGLEANKYSTTPPPPPTPTVMKYC